MIVDFIEDLHKALTETSSGGITSYALYRRLCALSIIAYMHEINDELEEISSKLDNDVDLNALEIDFDKYLNKAYWDKGWLLHNYSIIETEVPASSINHFTDYLPNGVEGYTFTPEMIGSFKNTLHQFCDKDRMNWRDIDYALNFGFKKMLNLLLDIKKKTQNPQAYLFQKLWDELRIDIDSDDILKEYNKWKEDHGEINFQNLKDKQTQTLVRLLSSDFLRFRPKPTKGEVNNSQLIIDEDSLETGSVLPDNIKEQCARLEYFVVWKDPEKNILSFNYERLGKYVYDHYKELESNLNVMIDTDIIFDAIHEDMAKLKSGLAKYLKRYEEDQIKELANDCKKILNTCKPFLKSDIRETLLEEYVDMAMYDTNIKAEVRSKLRGQSKNKFICDMIGHLSNCYVFDVKYTAEDFAKALHKEIVSVEQNTLQRYIKETINSRNGNLYPWTKNHIDELKNNKSN